MRSSLTIPLKTLCGLYAFHVNSSKMFVRSCASRKHSSGPSGSTEMTRLSEVTKPVFSRKELYPVSAPLRSGKLSTSTANRDSGYNKRIERFLPKDLALSVSADPETGTVNAFLHGCSGDQVDDIEHWLYRCQELVVHPLLMHFLLAEIQLERHAGVLREYLVAFGRHMRRSQGLLMLLLMQAGPKLSPWAVQKHNKIWSLDSIPNKSSIISGRSVI